MKPQQRWLVRFSTSWTWINTVVSSWFIAYHEVTRGPFSTPSGIQLACLGLAVETTAHCLAHCTQQGDERGRGRGEKKRAEQHWLHLESPGTRKEPCVLTSDTVKHSTSTFLSISHLPEVAGILGGKGKFGWNSTLEKENLIWIQAPHWGAPVAFALITG